MAKTPEYVIDPILKSEIDDWEFKIDTALGVDCTSSPTESYRVVDLQNRVVRVSIFGEEMPRGEIEDQICVRFLNAGWKSASVRRSSDNDERSGLTVITLEY